MHYGDAIAAIKDGKYASRKDWESNGAYIRLVDNQILWGSKDHSEQHYNPSHQDMLADDWNETSEEPGTEQ
jgi:hypothetical protein